MNKILVANRGEIAIRIMRTCRELGISSVGVYSEADKGALFARYANEAYCIGPAPAAESYLCITRIIEAAKKSGADAIHPGYGFLAENVEFVQACEREGIKFIGPSSKVLELTGNRVAARREMRNIGVPVMPGSDSCVPNFEQARDDAHRVGYPVVVKPCFGMGGIGIALAAEEGDLRKALESSRAIAITTSGSADVYIEKYLPHPRHIEFQLLADAQGNVVFMGERECSIQRRHQKVIEEAPSPSLTPQLRSEMAEIAINSARHEGYEGAGTIDFVFSDGTFYFAEADTRITLAHALTEVLTGIDIVKQQILIASGLPLGIKQYEIQPNGCAIECRINAEDPLNNFAPSPGQLIGYRSPGGIGVRVDSGVHQDYIMSSLYDPMISKLVVWGRNRDEAIIRMRRALYEYIIVGVKTNIPFLKAVMENSSFVSGVLETHFLERETSLLMDCMKRIIERDKQLDEKLSGTFE